MQRRGEKSGQYDTWEPPRTRRRWMWTGMGWDGMGWERRACLSAEGCPEKRGDRIEHRTLNRIRQPLVSDESHWLRTIVGENLARFKKSDLSSFPPVLFSRLQAPFAVDFFASLKKWNCRAKGNCVGFLPSELRSLPAYQKCGRLGSDGKLLSLISRGEYLSAVQFVSSCSASKVFRRS
jgi:hypothetical protein